MIDETVILTHRYGGTGND